MALCFKTTWRGPHVGPAGVCCSTPFHPPVEPTGRTETLLRDGACPPNTLSAVRLAFCRHTVARRWWAFLRGLELVGCRFRDHGAASLRRRCGRGNKQAGPVQPNGSNDAGSAAGNATEHGRKFQKHGPGVRFDHGLRAPAPAATARLGLSVDAALEPCVGCLM